MTVQELNTRIGKIILLGDAVEIKNELAQLQPEIEKDYTELTTARDTLTAEKEKLTNDNTFLQRVNNDLWSKQATFITGDKGGNDTPPNEVDEDKPIEEVINSLYDKEGRII